MIKNIIVGALLLVLFTACKKERTIHITAKNAVTGLPYAGLTYYVVQEKTGMSGEEFTTVATGTLDANGEAFITKKLKKAHSYAVRVEEPPNTCYNKQITFYFANQESNFECPFEFAECAYSKLIINNVNCEGPNDTFVLFRKNQINSIDGGFGWEHLGCAYWETTGYSDIAMGNVYFRWEVTRSGNTNIFYDTVYYLPGEYRTYEINY